MLESDSYGLLNPRCTYSLAVYEQPKADFGFDPLLVNGLSWVLYAIGMIFVVSSSIRLGITGTYCGDYFGILMKERVTGFPFNVAEGTSSPILALVNAPAVALLTRIPPKPPSPYSMRSKTHCGSAMEAWKRHFFADPKLFLLFSLPLALLNDQTPCISVPL